MNAASTGSKASKEYTDKLVVTINGESSPEQTTKIAVDTPKDGIMNITLPNFCLNAGEDMMYVGTIKVNEIPLTASGLYSTFTTNQTIQIEPGDIPIEGMWLGPMLGDVPLQMAGKISDDKFYTTIDIEMTLLGQTIHVVFGTDDFESSIHSTWAGKQTETTNVYTLQGMRVKSNVAKTPCLRRIAERHLYCRRQESYQRIKQRAAIPLKKEDKCRWRVPHRLLSYK